jgi:hypothetical protein
LYILSAIAKVKAKKHCQIMKQITVNIPDNKYSFFLELVKNLGLEKVKEEQVEPKEEVLKGIEQGFNEVKLIREGKMKGIPLKDFLDEL